MKNSPAVAFSAGLWYNTAKESAVWQTVSTFPVGQLQEMTVQLRTLGQSFFVIEDLIRNIEISQPRRCNFGGAVV